MIAATSGEIGGADAGGSAPGDAGAPDAGVVVEVLVVPLWWWRLFVGAEVAGTVVELDGGTCSGVGDDAGIVGVVAAGGSAVVEGVLDVDDAARLFPPLVGEAAMATPPVPGWCPPDEPKSRLRPIAATSTTTTVAPRLRLARLSGKG